MHPAFACCCRVSIKKKPGEKRPSPRATASAVGASILRHSLAHPGFDGRRWKNGIRSNAPIDCERNYRKSGRPTSRELKPGAGPDDDRSGKMATETHLFFLGKRKEWLSHSDHEPVKPARERHPEGGQESLELCGETREDDQGSTVYGYRALDGIGFFS